MPSVKPFSQVFACGLSLIFALLLSGCQSTAAPSVSTGIQTPTSNPAYAGKKILFVNSYHVGYEWSDSVEAGAHQILDNTGIDVRFVRMDTKNNTDETFRQDAGKAVKAEFDAFAPDVVVVSDDNALAYFVVPYLQGNPTPVVFTGVNWETTGYDLAKINITGMIEVEFADQLVSNLRPYIQKDGIGFISIDNETERKTASAYNTYFFQGKMKTYLVATYAEFKAAFLQAQEENGFLILSNNAGSSDVWDTAEAIEFFTANTRIPTGTLLSWMTPYTLLTVARVPEEMGEWAAETALRVLEGTPVSDIPVAKNRRARLTINLSIADRLNIVFSPSILRNAEIYPPISED